MKSNADNKHPPNFLQSPKLEERRPPTTATGEGSCPRPPPAPRPEPRNAGRRQRELEARHRLRTAPVVPCPGGGTDSSAATGGSPFRPSLPRPLPPLGQRVRLPDTGTPPPLALRLEPRILCAETKTRPGPLLLPGATRFVRPGNPSTPAGPKASFLAQSWGCYGAAPRTWVRSPKRREILPVLFPTPSELEGGRAAERRPGRG